MAINLKNKLKPLELNIICLVISLGFMCLLAGNSTAYAEIRDRVVAYVDIQAVTLSELESKFSETQKAAPGITKEEVLQTMVNRVLLLGEAKKIRLEAPSEEELLNEYIDLKIKALIRIKEEEIHDFYKGNLERFEGKEIEEVWDEIETYLIQRDLNERLKDHINELRERTCVRMQLDSKKKEPVTDPLPQ